MSVSQQAPVTAGHGTSTLIRTVRGIGWTLIATGVLILLYLVYLLFFTNLQTNAAQQELLEGFELEFGALDEALPGEGLDEVDDEDLGPVDPGAAYAAMWFERGGQRVVHDDTLYVVQGTDLGDLRRGPGHYSNTAGPGQAGNFAVAGHRTTYGAPFYNLDELVEGDEVHVVDRELREWVYVVRETRIVSPDALWVIGRDPLGRGGSWLTLTTCHPLFSASQRLIVFAELQA